MSWTRLDHDILMHGKWWPLSPPAFKLGIMLCVWANKYSDGSGVVPWGVIREMAGGTRRARRLMSELVEAGKPIKDVGILEPLEDGTWKIHNFERYLPPDKRQSADSNATSSARADAGRKSAEARKNKYGSAQPPRTNGAEQPEQNGGTSAEQARTNSPNKTPNKPEQNSASVSGSDRRKSSTSSSQDLSGSARVSADSEGGVGGDFSKFVSCPEDLELNAKQRTQLGSAGIPPWAVTALRARFLATAMGNPSETRTLDRWRQALAAAIFKNWNNPDQRPNPPEAFGKPAKTRGVHRDPFEASILAANGLAWATDDSE